jgi:hypothetical protein
MKEKTAEKWGIIQRYASNITNYNAASPNGRAV